MFTPEAKVKRFLDGIAYFMLYGHMDGIETNYRRIMHAKREIPMSSCPAYVENVAYGTSISSSDLINDDEEFRFQLVLEKLDKDAEKYIPEIKKKKRTKSKFRKKTKLGISGGEWYSVDTDGKFVFDGQQYIIDDQAAQYAPVETEYGAYYAMDKILASGGKFYDMNYDEVKVYKI